MFKPLARRPVLATLLRSIFTTTALVVLFYALPLRGEFTDTGVVLLPLGFLAFGALSWYELHAIVRASNPRLRAVQVLATVVPFFVIVVASTYYLMSASNPQTFSEPLTRTDALYFTMTVLSTLGFGDITPLTQTARVIVMIQIIGDLIVIGAGVRVLTGAIQRGMRRSLHIGDDPDDLPFVSPQTPPA